MSGLLAVSPHLDDAVLGASDLLGGGPGATVVTVFAGWPAPAQPLTEWDRAAGFSSASEAVTERRREDHAALSCLMARPQFLQHLDRQYGSATLENIVSDLRAAIDDCRPDCVVFPLGLHHPDHLTVAEAMLRLRDADEGPTEWIAWADSPYRALPGVLDARLKMLGFGRDLVPRTPPRHRAEQKAAAVRCYRSQLKALEDDDELSLDDVWKPEQYWSVGRTRIR